MQSLGIDLSTDPKKVWICEIDWSGETPQLTRLDRATELIDPRLAEGGETEPRPVVDEAGLVAALVERIAEFAPGPERVVGIDAPFGWPVAFVGAVSNWEAGDLEGFRKRPELRLRATDRFVQAATGLTPLSVSVDRIGSTAMVCAEVLSRYARRLDRPRTDRARALDGVAEVYPAGALRLWTNDAGTAMPTASYKSSFSRREELLREMVGLTFPPTYPHYPSSSARFGYADGWHGGYGYEPFDGVEDDIDEDDWRRPMSGEPITPPGPFQQEGRGDAGVIVPAAFREDLRQYDDALDAFLCALSARAVALGQCLSIDQPIETAGVWVKDDKPYTAKMATLRAERACELQAEAAESADAEGWIHLPRRGPIRRSLGLAEPDGSDGLGRERRLGLLDRPGHVDAALAA